jgi:hypothetical protein
LAGFFNSLGRNKFAQMLRYAFTADTIAVELLESRPGYMAWLGMSGGVVTLRELSTPPKTQNEGSVPCFVQKILSRQQAVFVGAE